MHNLAIRAITHVEAFAGLGLLLITRPSHFFPFGLAHFLDVEVEPVIVVFGELLLVLIVVVFAVVPLLHLHEVLIILRLVNALLNLVLLHLVEILPRNSLASLRVPLHLVSTQVQILD